MKAKFLGFALAAALVVGAVGGCGKSGNSNESGKTESGVSGENKTITVGAGITPHAEILNEVKEDLAEEGWELEVIEYNDYVLPNTALEDGNLDANYFQHLPYLENFNEENGTHLVGAAAVHFEPMAIYAGKTKSLDDIAKGATIAVPNDTTNEARALLLLEEQGWIDLKDGVGVTATVLDIEENFYDIEIKELEAAQVPKSIQDVDFAVINGNYAMEAGLTDPLAVEASDSLAAETYANYLCVREGEEESEKTKALVNVLLSDKVRDYINENYQGAVKPVF
ncbi:MAG: MetQ/NlpA family ABC transporter substrate-binding protein [Eubacteriales bacterium]|nr:MetQ/NlpA family ABC transporter substrate-binding protein [Eubacteriales bacterium]